jgi:fatty acid desaturase
MSTEVMPTEIAPAGTDPLRLGPDELKALFAKRDAPGWLRLTGHLALLLLGAWSWLAWWYPALLPSGMPLPFALLGLLLLGFALATGFACMHETVHRTAFRSARVNDLVAWGAGLLSFYNSTFYRHYHGWHHRFTNQPGKDPELEDKKPVTAWQYIVEISAVTWWIGKVRGHLRTALGRIDHLPYIPAEARASVIRSVRLQLAVYVVAAGASIACGSWLFALAWLLPLAVGQPFLRAIVLSEHTGCARTAEPYRNTRTTYTTPLVTFLMWDMPYHAEHHRYPAVPFHALARLHLRMQPHLQHLADRGYIAVQRGIIARLGVDPA